MESISPLLALSPLDGRYAEQLSSVRDGFCEMALIKARVQVEIAWLRALAHHPQVLEVPLWSKASETFLHDLVAHFSEEDALRVKAFEQQCRHDVKAVEYFLKERFATHPELQSYCEFLHFACTSEDINNLAYGLLLKQARETVFLPKVRQVLSMLQQLAREHAAIPMLARTHGQAATPTTLGKEWANSLHRLQAQVQQWQEANIFGKCNGAVGNYNAHLLAYPDIDWPSLSRQLVESLGLSWNPMTTQIEPHDYVAQWLHIFIQLNTVLIDLARDVWGYISLGYLQLKTQAAEVGSSTMPHKVNPIDFENAEGNLSLSNAMASFLAQRLPVSRWQRDLVDSTLMRNLGCAFAYGYLAWQSLLRGLAKVSPNQAKLAADLKGHPEVLAEAIQTVMRRYGVALPYEQLKQLTRGQNTDLAMLRAFIEQQPLPVRAKQRLLSLSPDHYLGLAIELAMTQTSIDL